MCFVDEASGNHLTDQPSPSSIKMLVDNQLFFSFNNDASLPFNQNFFVLLNLAMGGNFGGAVDPNFTSDAMLVDYVRVYK